MIRTATTLRLKSCATTIGLSPAGRVLRISSSPLVSRIAWARSISHLVPSQSKLEGSRIYDEVTSNAEDRLELGTTSKSRRFFPPSKSLHVARVRPEASDEEFRNAFSGLKGLVKAELIFNSGPLRDYKNTTSRGFGFLHFENEDAAAAAAEQLEWNPIWIRGQETKINPYTSRTIDSAEPSHTLHLSGLPLELQYLEVVELLRERSLNQKSIRFMTDKELNFLGAVGVAFKDTASGSNAKQALIGASLGGMELREHNVQYGRPLWDEKPTTTLMIIGISREPCGADRIKRVLAALDGVTRYKLVKDPNTGDYNGIAILNCESIQAAWRILEYINRKYPLYRVAFITDKAQYERKLERQGRERFHRALGQEQPRERLHYNPERDLDLSRPSSYKMYGDTSDQEQGQGRDRGN